MFVTDITGNSLTVVAVVTPEYLDRLRTTMPTWTRKKQIAKCPLILFAHKFDSLKQLDFAYQHFSDVKIIDWHWNGESQRENVFSAFVFGTRDYVKTSHWVKIDADAFFVSDDDLFDEDDFKYDICAHRWGYTKPSTWLITLDDWAESVKLPGKPLLDRFGRYEALLRNAYGHKRIISFVCLHKMSFIMKIGIYMARLPVPSHDTTLWYLANRLSDCKWKTKNLKSLGVRHISRLKSIKEALGQ